MPDDWRDQLIAAANLTGDDKALNMLNRHGDIGSLVKSFIAGQRQIRSGELSNGLPENPSAEQLSEWRTANSVPLNVDGYFADVAVGDNDKALFDSVGKAALENNVSKPALDAILGQVESQRQVQAQVQATRHTTDMQNSTQVLQETWGGELATNVNIVNNMISQLPESVRDGFSQATLADGSLLANSPEVLVWLADMGRKINPAATVVPNSNNPAQAMATEIQSIKDKMGTKSYTAEDRKRYVQLIKTQSAFKS